MEASDILLVSVWVRNYLNSGALITYHWRAHMVVSPMT